MKDRMKQSLIVWVLTFGSMALLGACSQDDSFGPANNHERIPVNFITGQADATNVRTTIDTDGETVWTQDDPIGIFMLKTGQALSATAIAEGADNIKHLATPNTSDATRANFSRADGADPILYPLIGNVDFVAYHPYSPIGTNITTDYEYKISVIPQSTLAEQKNIDVLYSNNVKNKARKREPVALEFTHALTRLVINVKAGSGMVNIDFSGISASLKGFPTTGKLTLADGKIIPDATTNNITPLKWTNAATGHRATFEAILIPQSSGTPGRVVVFTINGKEYTWKIDDNVKFEPAEMNTYNVSVYGDKVTVDGFSIDKWQMGPRLIDTYGSTGIKAKKIKAGTFQMGASATDLEAANNEKPQHWVKLSRDFYISKNPTTNEEFVTFLEKAAIGGYNQEDDYWDAIYRGVILLRGKNTPDGKGLYWYNNTWNLCDDEDPKAPVTNVTWHGANECARWLGGSLPTEAQWEYACRAGTTTPYSYGNTANGDYMWYSDNSSGKIHTVGEKNRNPWGLYDMHGNVAEWCLDRWDGSDNYPQDADTEADAVIDPLVTTGDNYVLRGGGWDSDAASTRSSYRDLAKPDEIRSNIGFRVVYNQ